MIFLNGSSGVFPGSVSSESDESEEEDWDRSSSDSRLLLELAVTSGCALLAVDAVVLGLLFEFCLKSNFLFASSFCASATLSARVSGVMFAG
jgi:hypothetical protein